MKNAFAFKTLAEFLEYFKDEETCREHFTAIRFRDGAYCPHCGAKEIYTFRDGKRFRCATCKQDFTIKTGTVFGESKVTIKKWFIAIYLLSTSSKGISSIQLAKQVGVTQKTGWFMDHRIRSAMKENKGQLFEKVEIDETFVGGLEKNKHLSKRKHAGTGGTGKTPVFGMRERGGKVVAKVAENVRAAELQPIIANTIAPGSVVYTDSWVGYKGLKGFDHTVVNHSAGQYVFGDAHTNSIESFWALFKRAYHGIFHWVSPKHMQRYADECAYRLNSKPCAMIEIFSVIVNGVADNKPLPYKELIA